LTEPHPGMASAFRRLFGRAGEVTGTACGRVNLIGEHTDYNGGFVLPTPIPQFCAAQIAGRGDRRVRVWSAELSGSDGIVEYELGREEVAGHWVDYVRGVTVALAARRHEVPGFDLALHSTVPIGSGLSSSAALEVSLLRALRDRFSLPIDDLAVAHLGRAAETDFVGAPIGIMDQMAASLATPGLALFLDTRSLASESLPLPAGTGLVVIDSGVAHNHAAGDYRTRRAECDRAAALLGVRELRDVGPGAIDRLRGLPPPLDRRARHVVTENQRVLDAVAALRAGEPATLGRLFTASHASQRDDYEVSVPDVDRLVEIALAEPDVLGARLTGGGFGGSIVALVREERAAGAAAAIKAAYERDPGRRATVMVPAMGPGPDLNGARPR